MTEGLILTGYSLSVYTRAARMALVARGLEAGAVECDPFGEAGARHLQGLHPFGRVPVLEHGAFRLWETQAILDYLDTLGGAPPLTPSGPRPRARMRQVMGIVDSYLYWPLVRQVFSNAVFQPMAGEAADAAQIAEGLRKAGPVLDALEEIAGEGLVLRPGERTLADCLLWPMLDYFGMAPDGAAMLAERPALAGWGRDMQACPVALATKPPLEALLKEGHTA
ncbi:MAG: glutathione S-transferase family protein [Roseovarius sp.]